MGGKWGRWKSPTKNALGKITKEYTTWNGLMNRVGRKTAYKDVVVSDNFKDYDFFYEWYNNQIGAHCFDENGRSFELDKDLLGDGLLYSENTCVIIPKELNNTFKVFNKRNISLPLGVSKEGRKRHYKVALSIGGKHQHIGYFETPEEASNAYMAERFKRLLELIDKYPLDNRVVDIIRNQDKVLAA